MPPPCWSATANAALELLSQAADQGLQLGELLDQLIDYSARFDGGQLRRRCRPAAQRHRPAAHLLKQQAKKLSLDTILAGLDVLVSSKNRLRFSQHSRVLVEMALVRLSQLEDLMPLGQLAQFAGAGRRHARPALRPRPQRDLPPRAVDRSRKKKVTE